MRNKKLNLKRLSLWVLGALASGAGVQQLSAQPILMGYYENWETYANYPFDSPQHPNADLGAKLSSLNAVVYAFLGIDPNTGSIQFTDPNADLQNTAQDVQFCKINPDICQVSSVYKWGDFDAFNLWTVSSTLYNAPLKIISVGGYGHADEWEQGAMQHPQAFANSVVAIMKQFPHVGGIDIDYEPQDQNGNPIPIQPSQIVPFINMVNILRATLDQTFPSNPKVITMAVMVNLNWIHALSADQWQQLAKDVNWFNIMGYDMNGAFLGVGGLTGLHSELHRIHPVDPTSDNAAIQALAKNGIPFSKLILGFPAYGRAEGDVANNGVNQLFQKSYQGNMDNSGCTTDLGEKSTCGGNVSYGQILKIVATTPGATIMDVPAGSQGFSGAYLNFNDPAVGRVFVSFDDPNTVAVKASYVKREQMAGMMEWVLGNDVPVSFSMSLLSAAGKGLGVTSMGKYTPSPPTNTWSTELALMNTGNAPMDFALVDANGVKHVFSNIPANSTQVLCTWGGQSPTCEDNLTLDQVTTPSVTVMVRPAGEDWTTCSGSLIMNPKTGYAQVASYQGANCAITG